MKLGFIVNPYAGIGGGLALKGSDGSDIRAKALAAGAEKKALLRAETFLRLLLPVKNDLEFYTYGGEMGESSLLPLGFAAVVLGRPECPESSPCDTVRAAALMKEAGVDCIAFLGGDGTARDVCSALGDGLPVVGVPAGVKMHSAVYARTPADAASLVASLAAGAPMSFELGEVMDIDEAAFRRGCLSAALYGCMKIPAARRMQGKKSAGFDDREALRGAARSVVREMEPGVIYAVGPGTSTVPIFDLLNIEKTLLGVDAVLDGQLAAADAAYPELLNLLYGKKYRIIVTTIGGQGCLFGRGNQQIGPELLRAAPKSDIIVVASPEKLLSIPEGAFYNDTGDPELDQMLRGYYRVRTGDLQETVFPCK